MSKKLEIKLNDRYKSFDPYFTQELLGDLVILSGVNGSGKTQLVDIIKGYKSTDSNQKINRIITQDGVVLDVTLIAHKSFRDYSSIGELTGAQFANLINARDQIFGWYNQFRLDHNNPNSASYKDSIKRAKALLIEKFGEEKFNNGLITREEIKDAIPRDFVLFQDDIFTNKVGEIFFNYVSTVNNKEAEAGKNGTRFDHTTLPAAPWKELNDLFAKLNFGYRFRDSYERVNDEINEQPAIYALQENGSIDLTQKRNLSDLSDGEKALISLTFAVLASEQTHPQLLLLDEYDATLNPSLTDAFFVILQDFFIEKGVQVIVVTHSSATLSLAPDYTSFYEVYKRKGIRPRVLEVQRDQYEELAIANKRFYDKIENQEARYSEIEAEVNSLKELVEKLKQPQTKLQVISEGKNIEHVLKAIQLIDKELLANIKIVTGAEDTTSKDHLKKAFEIISKFVGSPKALFVWDCDAITIIDPVEETDTCKKYCFEKNNENSKMEAGIENLYPIALFTEDVYKIEEKKIIDGITTSSRVDKNKFLAKIKLLEDKEMFTKFVPLIEKIKSLIVIEPQTVPLK